MPKDKEGNKLTWKEYMTRWKAGIEGITPYQQTRVQIRSTWIIVVGILGGLVASGFAIKQLWWLTIILIGALFNTLVIQLQNYQKFKILKQLEGGLTNEQESTT